MNRSRSRAGRGTIHLVRAERVLSACVALLHPVIPPPPRHTPTSTTAHSPRVFLPIFATSTCSTRYDFISGRLKCALRPTLLRTFAWFRVAVWMQFGATARDDLPVANIGLCASVYRADRRVDEACAARDSRPDCFGEATLCSSSSPLRSSRGYSTTSLTGLYPSLRGL